MTQPTPEEWWESLGADDRPAHIAAARRPQGMPEEIADKLTAAGIPVQRWGYEGGQLEPQFPKPYAAYALRHAKPEAAESA